MTTLTGVTGATSMTVDCTCPSTLTREQALARLMACPATPRGERLAAYAAANTNEIWCKGRYPWWERHFGNEFHEYVSQHESGDWPVPANIRAYAAPLRRAREERQKWKRIALDMAPLRGEVHRLQLQRAFSLYRDPFDLMPAIDAYAEVDAEGVNGISGGKMREYIRRWLAGESFRHSKTLDHEKDEP